MIVLVKVLLWIILLPITVILELLKRKGKKSFSVLFGYAEAFFNAAVKAT